MAIKKFKISDPVEYHKIEESFDETELGIEGCKVTVLTMFGGLSDGVQRIDVTTPKCRFWVLPTRGMNIWKAEAGAEGEGDQIFGWNSPAQGPVHPKYVPLTEPGGLGWLDGFDELLTRCGLESNGAPEFDEENKLAYPLHGRIANKPARRVWIEADSETGEISIVGEVLEARFHFSKLQLTARVTIKSGEKEIRVEDEVKNLSASPAEYQLLYHINFGDPLLDGGSQFLAPAETIVPRNEHAASGIEKWNHYPAPQAGTEEQVYFFKMLADAEGETKTLLKNAHSTSGVCIGYNIKQLPVYTLWKNPTAIEDGYVTGLEPGTNFPNPRSFEGEQGRVGKLEGGASAKLGVRIKLLTNEAEVTAAEQAVRAISADKQPQVFDAPQPGWCADA